MKGRVSVIKLLVTVVLGTLLSGLVLGLLGYLLAGPVGFSNLVRWGLGLGLFGSISVGLGFLIDAHYWGGYIQRYGDAEFKRISEGESKTKDY